MPARSKAISPVNLGLYLDRPSHTIPEGGLEACRNVRAKEGEVRNENMGWDKFMPDALGAPVLLIDNFFETDGVQHLLFGTTKDLFEYRDAENDALLLTPRYEAGTISVTNASKVVTGSGATFQTAGIKAGDYLHVGATGQRDPMAAWWEVESVDSETQITLVLAYTGATDSGLDYTLRKVFTADELDYWSSSTFPQAPGNVDLWFATNGVDEVVKWNGSDTQVTVLSGLGFRCRQLLYHKNMMLYGYIIETGLTKPGSVRNSAPGDPEEVTDVDLGASELRVAPAVDELVVLAELGDVVVAYGTRSATLMQFAGDALLWILRTAIVGIGPIAGRAFMDFGDFHEFLGTDSQYRFDGVQVTEIGGQVFREVLRTIDPSRFAQAAAHIDEENGETLWVVPLTSDPGAAPTTAYTAHYLEAVGRKPVPVMVRDLPATAMGFYERLDTLRFSDLLNQWSDYGFRWNDRFFNAAFPFNLFGDLNGYIYTLGTSSAQDGAEELLSYARFPVRAMVDGYRKGYLRHLIPFLDKRSWGSLSVRVYGTDRLGGDPVLLDSGDYDLMHEGRHFVAPRAYARYWQPEFRSEGKSEDWSLSGFQAEVEIGGLR